MSRAVVKGFMVVVVVAVSLGLGCKDATEPGERGITFVAGESATDTIDARLVQALIVEVRDSRGRAASGVTVRFDALVEPEGDPFSSVNAYVARLDQLTGEAIAAVDTTDDRGRAAVRVRLGPRVGAGRISVTVPELGYIDTATYVITAGRAASVAAIPGDTAMYVGRTMTLRSTTTDRRGNPRTGDAVTLSRISGPVTLNGSQVTAQEIGVARIQVQAFGVSDTTTISVVPSGVLAVSLGSAGVGTMNLDGSDFRVLTSERSAWVRWAPDGSAVTFDNDYAVPARIVTMNGAVRPVRQSSAGTEAEMYPVFSPDGEWVYFSVITGGQFKLWRARPDGSQAAPLATNTPADDFYPAPSPDGTKIIYINRFGQGRDTLRILDLATGNVNRINVPGHAPAWSPNGELIAYADLPAGYVLKVMRPDGTERRQVSLGGGYEKSVQWSPDGKYLIAYNTSEQAIHIIDVATSVTIPVRYGRFVVSPDWR